LTVDTPYVLISRSFNQSKDVGFRTESPVPFIPGELSLLEAIIYDTSHRHPVIVLGDKDLEPDDPAGRALYVAPWPDFEKRGHSFVFGEDGSYFASIDKTWEDIFVLLGDAAQVVLVIPSTTDGALKEIELIKKHGLGLKAVFYMWPEKGRHPYVAICGSAAEWEALRAPCREHGLLLPPHSAEGALLLYDDDLSTQVAIVKLPAKNILSNIFLVRDYGHFRPLKEIAMKVRNIEIAANAEKYTRMWGYENIIPTDERGAGV
jgi:hypothetical protein